jgi:hypothetical protein
MRIVEKLLIAAALAAFCLVIGAVLGYQFANRHSQDLIIEALDDKSIAEAKHRDLQKELANALLAKKSAIASSAGSISTGLRVTVCASDLSASSAAGNFGNGTGDIGRFVTREVDLSDIERQIIELGKDRDNCAAKVEALQRGYGYTVGNP